MPRLVFGQMLPMVCMRIAVSVGISQASTRLYFGHQEDVPEVGVVGEVSPIGDNPTTSDDSSTTIVEDLVTDLETDEQITGEYQGAGFTAYLLNLPGAILSYSVTSAHMRGLSSGACSENFLFEGVGFGAAVEDAMARACVFGTACVVVEI